MIDNENEPKYLICAFWTTTHFFPVYKAQCHKCAREIAISLENRSIIAAQGFLPVCSDCGLIGLCNGANFGGAIIGGKPYGPETPLREILMHMDNSTRKN
jgi:hypothetical protein